MSRPGHDLSWRAIRQRRLRELDREEAFGYESKSTPTPLLAHSSKSLLANVTSVEDQPYVNSSNPTLPMSVMNHIVPRQSRCKNPHHHHHESAEAFYPRDLRAFRSDMKNILGELKYLTGHIRKEEEEDDALTRLEILCHGHRSSLFGSLLSNDKRSSATWHCFSAPNFFKFR